MAQQESSSSLPKPLRPAAAVLRKVPGAEMVGRAAEGTLDRIGAVSPRGRRLVVYAGAGVLGVAGLVEWPVALAGAAVVWLTQSRPGDRDGGAGSGEGADREPVGELESPAAGKAARGRKASGKGKKADADKGDKDDKDDKDDKKGTGGRSATAGRKASAGKASSGAKASAVSMGRPRVTVRLHTDD